MIGSDERTLKVRPPKRKKLYEEIVAQIDELIAGGELAPGDRLPSERKLAEIFRVSRNSVREAIRALEEKGILISRPGDGTYVSVDEERSLVEPLADAIEEGRKKLAEVFEFRMLVEPEIAALAAMNAEEEDIRRLRDAVEQQRDEIAAGWTGERADQRFHMLVAKATGNSVLNELVNRLGDTISESRSEFLQNRERKSHSLDSHERIIEAIASGDPAEAKVSMRDHLYAVQRIALGEE